MNEPADPIHSPQDDALGAELLSGGRLFLANLFDVRMHSVVTVAALPILYALGMVIFAAGYVAVVVIGFHAGVLAGLFCLFIAGPVLFVAAVATLRMVLEFMLVIFRLSAQMDAVVQQTREIAVDLPRLNFWKSFAKRRDDQG
ncbi:MAG: DUF4282 domain-containing protein [Nevskiaceae bacterium]|nr:MAG: DUF4282 domain-containing protein [Nevskiaceae bacterium]TBR73977.1 MAG: DUF4282 domain-containing protein [Nevskiaceae bacterium]